MTQIGILSGIYSDSTSQLRTSLPRNLVPVPKKSGVSNNYLGPSPGSLLFGNGPGVDRGGINWNGTCYRVMGPKFVRVDESGSVAVLGEVGIEATTVSLDYSFDRLAIAAGTKLFYWDGATLTQVTDPDLGIVIDMLWIDGYFMTTDGSYLIVTELNDPMAVNPLKYGSSEVDPDPIRALKKVRNEVMALNRYSIETFQNVGGNNFPFQRIDGAQIQKGTIGTHTCCNYLDTVAFLGSGRNEAPAVYLASGGGAQKVSTREIETILLGYTESQLFNALVEARTDKANQHLLIHLPDQTLVFDGSATAALGEPVWFTLTTSITGLAQYRMRNFVWCYDKWLCGDPTSGTLGVLVDNISTHYGATIGWEFGVPMLYNEGSGAIVHEMELVALPGNVAFGPEPVIWTSYSLDGQNWSQERPTGAGAFGQTLKRICWRRQGKWRLWRVQKFRGTSDAHLSMLRLEMQIEPLGA